MNYTTKLGNTYDLAQYIDCDMPHGDYKELVEVTSNIAPTMDGWCGREFNIEDTDIITVSLCLNPENTQKTLYAYIPEAEKADYELEIQMMESDRYTDYSDTLADKLRTAIDNVTTLEQDLEGYKTELDEAIEDGYEEEEIENIKEKIEDIEYDLNSARSEKEEIKKEIKKIEEKCVWNSWNTEF